MIYSLSYVSLKTLTNKEMFCKRTNTLDNSVQTISKRKKWSWGALEQKILGATIICFMIFVRNVFMLAFMMPLAAGDLWLGKILKIFSISYFPVDELNIWNQSFITLSPPILVKMIDPAGCEPYGSRALLICYKICLSSSVK